MPAALAQRPVHPAVLLFDRQLDEGSQCVRAHDSPFQRVAKSQDRFSHLWGEPKKPEDLGHLSSGVAELPSQLSLGSRFSRVDPVLPLLGKGHGILIKFNRRWGLYR